MSSVSKRPGEDDIEERKMGVYHCDDCEKPFLLRNALAGHYARSDCTGGVGR